MSPTGKGKTVIVNMQRKIVGVFPSVSEMCREMNLERRAVMRCLSGEVGHKSVRGYWFEYPNPQIPIEEYRAHTINPKFKPQYKRLQ